MFQESLVESTPLLRTRNRWPVFVSVAAQATILTLAVIIPMLHPEVLPTHALHRLEFLPPPKAPTPPPQQQPVRVQVAPSTAPPAPPMRQAQIDPGITHPLTSYLNPVPNSSLPVAFGPPSTSPFTNITTATPTPRVVPTPAAPPGPVNVSQGVLAGYLLAPIQVQYPPIARAAGQQGTVIIHAIISKTGRVEDPRVISGPLMLQPAALEAVRNARYRPFLLNQQPTEVETTFSINFHIGS